MGSVDPAGRQRPGICISRRLERSRPLQNLARGHHQRTVSLRRVTAGACVGRANLQPSEDLRAPQRHRRTAELLRCTYEPVKCQDRHSLRPSLVDFREAVS